MEMAPAKKTASLESVRESIETNYLAGSGQARKRAFYPVSLRAPGSSILAARRTMPTSLPGAGSEIPQPNCLCAATIPADFLRLDDFNAKTCQRQWLRRFRDYGQSQSRNYSAGSSLAKEGRRKRFHRPWSFQTASVTPRRAHRLAYQYRRIGALTRHELLRPAAPHVGDIEAAVLIHAELVRAPQAARLGHHRAP